MKKAAEFLALNFFWTKQLKPILKTTTTNIQQEVKPFNNLAVFSLLRLGVTSLGVAL